MLLPITKSARRYGYIIWSNKTSEEFEKMFAGQDCVDVYLNEFYLGKKLIDRKYHRISIGWKFTRALPVTAKSFVLKREEGNILKVECN